MYNLSAHSQYPHRNIERKSAFTLSELLVSIVIIALLASALLPTIEAARGAAQGLSCSNRLRQIGLMHTHYTTNNNGYVIAAVQNNSVGNWINYFFVETDLNYQEAYQCPSLPQSAYFNPYGGSGKYNVGVYSSYVMNTIKAGTNSTSWDSADIPKPGLSWGWTTKVHDNYTSPIRLGRIQSPSNTIFITETPETISLMLDGGHKSEVGKHINRYIQTDHGLPVTGNASANRRRVGKHHDSGFNVLMGDGRVVRIQSSDPSQWVAWTE